MNIPLNRWVVVGILVATAIFGGDFVSAIMRAVTAVGAIYVPAA